MQQIVLATGNAGKVRELRQLFAPLGVDLISQNDLKITSVPETGTTFSENALIKARHAARHSGLAAMADDSGLEVAALGGAPGVYSARYAGDSASDVDNYSKLLQEMAGRQDRTACFCCVMAYVRTADDPEPLIATGRWEGLIRLSPSGEGGFGYDPVFEVPAHNCSAAELSLVQKNALSHRYRAARELLGLLQQPPV